MKSLRKAIAYFGSAKQLARMLKVHPAKISQWITTGKLIDYEHAWKIDLATCGQITINELRPDCQAMNERIKKQLMTDFIVNEETHDLEVVIDKIKISYSLRQDKGNLQLLAEDIQKNGLLEPVGVNDHLELLYGERRLKAFQLLGFTRIPVRLLPLKSPLEIQLQQYQGSKQLTISERARLGQLLGKQLGERRGRPKQSSQEYPAAVTGRSCSHIAELTGFGNRTTLRLAIKVIEQGVPEVIKAMDQKYVSVAAAAQLTQLSKDKQLQQLDQVCNAKKISKKMINKTQASLLEHLQDQAKNKGLFTQLQQQDGRWILIIEEHC